MMADFGLPVMAVMIGLILNVPMSKTKDMVLIPIYGRLNCLV